MKRFIDTESGSELEIHGNVISMPRRKQDHKKRRRQEEKEEREYGYEEIWRQSARDLLR
jgi:hypothetical protein